MTTNWHLCTKANKSNWNTFFWPGSCPWILKSVWSLFALILALFALFKRIRLLIIGVHRGASIEAIVGNRRWFNHIYCVECVSITHQLRAVNKNIRPGAIEPCVGLCTLQNPGKLDSQSNPMSLTHSTHSLETVLQKKKSVSGGSKKTKT